MADDEKDDQSEKPPSSDFQQQNLKAWQPLLTPIWVIGTFFAIGLMFVPLGMIVLDASNSVVEVEIRYDNLPEGDVKVEMKIPEDMKPPIFMYYKLTNFYQNHRRYVKSRSDDQLRGLDPVDISSCVPLETWEGKALYPCGLIANSYFTDTFQDPVVTKKSDGGTVRLSGDDWTDKGIAWESDVNDKFAVQANINPDTTTTIGPNGQLPSVVAEDFIVWMRTAGLPTFKKLRYKIKDTPLKKGDIIAINVTNVFPSVKEGEKWVVLSTTSWLGGKNDFLGYAYIVVGVLCLLLALLFFVKHKTSPRLLGDMKYFNWSGKGNANASDN